MRDNDRLIGAEKYCLQWGIKPTSIVKGIVAALHYNNTNDMKSVELQDKLLNEGLNSVLVNIMGIDLKTPLGEMIKNEFSNGNYRK